MKQLFLASLCILAIACNQTPEKKAEKLIKDSIQKTLILPDSYQSVETIIDSAYSPFSDPAFIDSVFDLFKKWGDLKECEVLVKKEKSMMSILSSPMSSFGRSQYKQAKERYEEILEIYDKLNNRYQSVEDKVHPRMFEAPSFIGYVVHHRYRSSDNDGDVQLTGRYYLLDSDMLSIKASWDEDQYNQYKEYLQQLIEASKD